MDVLEKDEFLKAYRNIAGHLKRKFVRKPNVAEAIESYENLGRQQADVGFIELSAACRLAAAQLEQATSQSNVGSSQGNLYLESARSYSSVPDAANTFFCYEAAISSCNDPTIAWMNAMEAGQAALALEEYQNATSFFSTAFKMADTDIEKSLAGEKLASSYIQQGLYSHALKVLSGIKSSQKILITKLLLALNLKLHSHGESKLSQNIQTTLEESKGSFHPPQLQHALDSLVGGHQIDESLVPTLWQYLNSDQKQLFVCLLSNV